MPSSKKILTPMGAALVFVVGGASTAWAEEVPFRANLGGTIAFTSQSTAVMDGKGVAVHMGRATLHSEISILGPASCGGFLVEQRGTLTGANGDTLAFTVHDENCPTETPGVLEGEGTYVVTGGTGRFAGATGDGDFHGIGDVAHGIFSMSLDGVIELPGDD